MLWSSKDLKLNRENFLFRRACRHAPTDGGAPELLIRRRFQAYPDANHAIIANCWGVRASLNEEGNWEARCGEMLLQSHGVFEATTHPARRT
jgi:hypothetical protein